MVRFGPSALMQTSAEPGGSPVRGILWMLLTGAIFVAVIAVVKHVGDVMPAPQAAFLRYALGLVFLIPMLPAMRSEALDRAGLGLFVLRGAVHSVAVTAWFFSMTQITIAEVTALGYLNPVFVTVAAAFFLGEKLAARRIAAVAAALIGALLIVRPGFRELSIGHITMLGAAVFLAASYLLAKLLAERYRPEVVVGWLSVWVTIGLAPIAIAVWVPPSPSDIFWLFVVAFFATAGHYTMTLAFRAAPLAVTQPVTFLQLVWATLLGVLFFAEPVDIWVVAGGTAILSAVSFITWREYVLKRRATPSHIETKH